MDRSRRNALILFVVLTLCMIVVILHGTLGFVRPDNAHEIFADSLHAVIWIAFLYSVWNLFVKFRAGAA
jgi:hypothetical protein